ncbi:MAG TPA: hypothetical protein VI953_03215 [Candidatus Paceibacterota bacterium]
MDETGKVLFTIDPVQNLVTLAFKAPGVDDHEHLVMAKFVKSWYEDLKTKYPEQHFRVLVDLTNAGIPNKGATDIYTATLSDKQIERTAIFGVAGAVKSIINFIVSASGKGDRVQFFIDKDKALEWLKAS